MIELVHPTVPRCTKIVVNFYSLDYNNCIKVPSYPTINNESNYLCSTGPLIGIAELNETGYFIETSNITLDKLLREKQMVWTGNCDGSVCWDGYAILVPGTTEYLGGITQIINWEKNKQFESEIVVRLPEGCRRVLRRFVKVKNALKNTQWGLLSEFSD